MKQFLYKYRFLLALSALNFLLIFVSAFNSSYGYFIDEFYYIACAKRPAFGYVDHPPFAPFVLTLFSTIFGHSVIALRFLPALAASVAVFLTGKLTEQLGGSNRAQILAALALVCTPVAVAFGGFYSMNVFEPALVLTMLLLAVEMIQNGKPHMWYWIGLTAGIGLMNKHTFAVAILMFIVALLLGGHWRKLYSKHAFIGAVITFIILLPNIIWQVLNGAPSLEFYRNITASKNVYTPPLQFIIGQLINMSPVTALIWITGALYLGLNKNFKQFQFFSWFFVLTFCFMLLSGSSRADRTLFAYPAVFAGGAIGIDRFLAKYKTRVGHFALSLFLLAGLLLSLPLILPYFSYEQVDKHVKTLGINTEIERGKKPPLPQLLADRIGWEEKSQLLFDEYNKLTDEEKKQTVIATDNYGKAGALELFGAKYGIEQVFCGHNNYYLWGTGKASGSIVLALDDVDSEEDYWENFDSVVVSKAMFIHPYVSQHENNIVVFICRKPKAPLQTLFEGSKVFY